MMLTKLYFKTFKGEREDGLGGQGVPHFLMKKHGQLRQACHGKSSFCLTTSFAYKAWSLKSVPDG